MSKLFPPEIIENSTQQHFVDFHTTSKILYIIVVIVILIVFAALPFINIDITIQNRGIIRSLSENNLLQLIVNGEIESISIYENKMIEKGDTLIKLKTDKIDDQISLLEQKIYENNRFFEDLSRLYSQQYEKLETAIYVAEYNEFLSKVNEIETKIILLEKEFSTSQQLFYEDVIPEMEFLREKNSYDGALSQLAFTKEQYFNKWQIEQTRLKLEKLDFVNSIFQLKNEKKNYNLVAPICGTISQFSGVQVGSFINAGQTIAFISPNQELIVECYIAPSGIGYIKEGQEVLFQLDAFNYNQWGLAHGKVKDISTDISMINENAVIRVRCSIDEEYLQLKNGFKGQLKKGMTLTGRFYLTERSLWHLLFDKFDNWLNPKLLEQE